ncbi:MAG: 2,3-bisphosphoglycerate-independent phosphoglycerate mutase [Alphaproteobacteria bacterium]
MGKQNKAPTILCVLDGWGSRPQKDSNAIALAQTPTFDAMLRECPNSLLKTSGLDVGLPEPQMGNSEVGHLNIGAGRIVNQDTRRIDAAIEGQTLNQIPLLKDFIASMRDNGGTCHLMGLVSNGGVHSHQSQIVALAQVISNANVPVTIHAFLDGRDTPPQSADVFINEFERDLSNIKGIKIGSISGRFYSMDRDSRWERIELAYKCLVKAEGEKALSPSAAITAAYKAGTSDEFVLPTVIGAYQGMRDGDGVLMANFRADRAREILDALLDPSFDGFETGPKPCFSSATGLVEYSKSLNQFMTALFPPEKLTDIMGDVLAKNGIPQLRIAETEKYAHVTFFFNGGKEEPFAGEDRILVPSPKVKTYDEKPEMSATELTDILIEKILSEKYGFIFVNFANPDMVGHTGNLEAAIKAIETVDNCLLKIRTAIETVNGTMLVTADHGNAETMLDPETGAPFTSHTTNPVPSILVNGPSSVEGLADGRLADVAPTLLELMDIKKPSLMTGNSLLRKAL